jgi:hypothetical protein
MNDLSIRSRFNWHFSGFMSRGAATGGGEQGPLAPPLETVGGQIVVWRPLFRVAKIGKV